MAKKKEMKKKNLKLRKQIRRTLGALFMASAIVVAAIPVSNIEAGTTADEGTNDTRGNAVYPTGTDSFAYVNFGAGYPNLKPPMQGGVVDETKVFPSYMIRKLSGGQWSLNWQFKYFIENITGTDRAIISQYNSTYPETTVTLSNTATAAYYKVSDAEYSAFYTTGGGGYVTYTFAYADYAAAQTGAESAGMLFFKNYRKSIYDTFSAACKVYKDYLAAKAKYDADLAAWELIPDNPATKPVAPVVVPEPPAVTLNPSIDFTEAEKLTFYCKLAETAVGTSKIPGINYSLVAVTDNTGVGTPGGGTAVTAYIAQGGTPIAPAYNDVNGFLVTKASTEVIGIGENAFEGISNVDYLTIPEEIKYVGDEAFIGSFIKSIDMKNVENIGNRAFYNCTELSSVAMTGTKQVGTESFYNSGITSVVFPYSVSLVGPGAFAECTYLQTVDFSKVNATCEVKPYAFYNCIGLNSVEMSGSAIKSIGEGAFALLSAPSGTWTRAELPLHITGANLGNYLFAGRSNLLTVIMPSDYGSTSAVTLPSGTFRYCRNLQYVEFPDTGSGTCGLVSFSELLFLDVLNEDFYVKGPEKSMEGTTALPRESTWKASSRASDSIPYVYKDSKGVMCYEVSDKNGFYILQANEAGQLTSCTLRNKADTTTEIDLVIPSRVGGYTITTVTSNCFSEQILRNRIRSITISDHSLSSLEDNVFANLPKLERVVIGNSVQKIGNGAFLNCPKLTDVTFNTPNSGYDGFTIGTNAFKTDSSKLTMHGDIVPGYAPFEFAMGKDSGKIDNNGTRICYKSLAPDFLTVMYDNQSGEVTLVEYPKYGNLDKDHADYLKSMENYYYNKYIEKEYDSYRKAFYDAVSGVGATMTLEQGYKSILYGPWINSESAGESGIAGLKAFYTQQPYSITGNYERGVKARGDFEAVTDAELQWINSTLNIVVPAGITSIDAKSYFTSSLNSRNLLAYFNTSSKEYDMATKDGEEAGVPVVGGLFSGTYQDYTPSDTTLEKHVKGNDRVLSIIMSTVKKLPDNAFDSCERLQTVVLGSACEDIGNAPFRGCTSLITVTGNNYYKAENGLVYSVNPDGSYTIEECLAARGNLVGSSYIDATTDPSITKVSAIAKGAFEDCDYLTRVFLNDATKLKIIPENCFNDCDKLQAVEFPDSVKRIESNAFGGNTSVMVTIPGNEVYIATDAFEHVNTNTIITYKDSSAHDYADYYGLDVVLLDGRYKVDFLDYDGTALCPTQYVTIGKSAVPPENPIREGYLFKGWSKDYNNVQANLVIVALYTSTSQDENKFTVTFYNYDDTIVSVQKVTKGESAVAPLAPVRSGYTFTGWKPATFTDVQKDLDIFAQFEKITDKTPGPSGSGNPTPSGSPLPTASGTISTNSTENETTKYTASISGGSGSGSYAAGTVVTISAYATGDGKVFDKWTTSSTGVGFLDATSPTTTFTMPAGNVTITATYKNSLSSSSGSGSATNNGSGNSNNNNNSGTGGTTVEITKPGIPNTGLASANVNGSLDNFVVKITDDSAATAAAVEALQKHYGDISNIRYLPMDISLYDATGTTKITDTAGITVDITVPLPNDLVSYAGNNRVASVAGGTLENLNSKFTTIDGVPYMNFTATHFSPYVVYVDTANLTEGMIDATPKTGDFLHPKWFLVIGLVSMSMLLFLKKDRVSTIRLA